MKLFRKIAVSVFSAAIFAVSSISCVSAEDSINSFYEKWKNNYVVRDTYVTDEDQYYVWYSGEKYNNDNQSVAVTVSEAHGYGMLITACLDDKELFDGMYRYYKAHTSDIGSNLMSWQQCDNGTALIDGASDGSMQGGSADSATDGDMDIAYSLLIADSVWGSDGDISYKSEAVNIINDIMKYEVNKTDWILQLGDWVYYCDENDKYYSATRASDFIMQYMPVFAEVTGDDRWLEVYNSTYDIIDKFVDEYNTGLLPDFIIKDSSGEFTAAPEYFLEDKTDGSYGYNSCRTPWRIGMDCIVNNNPSAKKFTETINSFIINSTGGNPDNITAGYTLDGKSTEDYNDLCFDAPFIISAKCGDNSEWNDTLWNYILDYYDDVYYGDTIKMLCMISYTDKWIVPETQPDIISLKKYILGINDTAPESSDINKNNVTDVFDLSMIKNKSMAEK